MAITVDPFDRKDLADAYRQAKADLPEYHTAPGSSPSVRAVLGVTKKPGFGGGFVQHEGTPQEKEFFPHAEPKSPEGFRQGGPHMDIVHDNGAMASFADGTIHDRQHGITIAPDGSVYPGMNPYASKAWSPAHAGNAGSAMKAHVTNPSQATRNYAQVASAQGMSDHIHAQIAKQSALDATRAHEHWRKG